MIVVTAVIAATATLTATISFVEIRRDLPSIEHPREQSTNR